MANIYNHGAWFHTAVNPSVDLNRNFVLRLSSVSVLENKTRTEPQDKVTHYPHYLHFPTTSTTTTTATTTTFDFCSSGEGDKAANRTAYITLPS